MDTAHIIVAHTPLYVWGVLALLLFLGGRRLKPRRTHLALAALAPAGFFVWSVATAASLFFGGDKGAAIVAWSLAFLGGALSGPIRTVPRPSHVHGWIFQYAATRQPLTLYLLLWSTRYSWARAGIRYRAVRSPVAPKITIRSIMCLLLGCFGAVGSK